MPHRRSTRRPSRSRRAITAFSTTLMPLCHRNGARRCRGHPAGPGEDAVNEGYKVYTTIDGRLQTAANRAVQIGLIGYDRRHGYRGPLRHVSLDARSGTRTFDAVLANLAPIGDLRPAVVLSVSARSARVYVQGSGEAEIDWDGLEWARQRVSDTRTGATPQRAADVLQRGDIVDVISNGQGVAAGCPSNPMHRVPWSRSIPTMARSSPWSGASTTTRINSTAQRRGGASRARASSRFYTRAPSIEGSLLLQSCWMLPSSTTIPIKRRSGARKTTSTASTDRCDCAKDWCSRATWSRFAWYASLASTSRAAVPASSASARTRCQRI